VLDGTAGVPEDNSTFKIWQSNNALHIVVENEEEIRIFNTAGKELLKKTILSGESLLQLDFPAGIYFLSDQNGNRYKFYFGI
jgi:hypothetical protein